MCDITRHKHGYVTSTQFHQCLSQLGINLTNEEVQALMGRFSDKEGVNYLAVLQCVQPSYSDHNKYQLRMTRLMQPKVCVLRGTIVTAWCGSSCVMTCVLLYGMVWFIVCIVVYVIIFV